MQLGFVWDGLFAASRRRRGKPVAVSGDSHGAAAAGRGRAELYLVSIAVYTTSGSLNVFHARVAASPEEVVARLVHRLGKAAVTYATVDRGYDAEDRYVDMLVSPKMRDLLQTLSEDPASPLAQGFELHVEHRLGG